MCAAREPRRLNGLCGTCSELEHLSCHCLLQRDRIDSDVPTLSSPPQINRRGRGGTGCDLPMSPPSYSGRSGGTGYDIPWSPPQYSGSNNGYGTNEGPQQRYGRGADGSAGYGATFAQQQTMSPPSYSGSSGGTGYDIPWSPPQYSGSNNGYGTNEGPQQRYGRGADGSAGYGATFAQQQTMSPPSYSGPSGGTGYDIPWSPPQYSGSNNGYGTNEGPQQRSGRGADGSAGYGATFAQQQPAPRLFRSFGWDQRYACRNGPPVNGGLSNSIAQGQAQRSVGVDDQEEGQRPSTEVQYHGGPLSEVLGPPE